MTKIFVFPGQGSQQKGMGKDLFDKFPELIEKADSILNYSVKNLCLNDDNNKLQYTQFTQPALYIINCLSYLNIINETSMRPDFLAGHSLGEYSALLASEAFDFITGLRLVKKRGEIMSAVKNGGMAAVIGFEPDKIKETLAKASINTIDIANYNSPSQTVLSGPKEEIGKVKSILEDAGARMVIPLKVSGAFHSRYMKKPQSEFELFINQFVFDPLKIPVISNVTALPHTNESLCENISNQMSNPVRWTETIQYLKNLPEPEFTEIGPGNVLTKLIKQIPFKKMETSASKNNNKKTSNSSDRMISINNIGDKEFKQDYNLKYPLVTGSMYRGISSEKMVIKIAKAGMLGFFGTGGCDFNKIESAINTIKMGLKNNESFGMNLLYNLWDPEFEEKTVDLFIKHEIKIIEASAYIKLTPAVVRYRILGLSKNDNGSPSINHKIIAKISRPEIAEAFLSPPPKEIAKKLLDEGKISSEQYELSQKIPMADDLTAEANSGGHTDNAVAYALTPAIIKMRDEYMQKFRYTKRVRVGAAGGIGTPEAVAASLIMGADYVVTGSINQCTVEAETSDLAKDLLEDINIQDTELTPTGDMFEIGAKAQVLKKGVFFPSRSNKLYDLYKFYNSIDQIDEKTKNQIEKLYFKKSFDEVYEEAKKYFSKTAPKEIERAEKNPKHKMALIFRWYFSYTVQLAFSGDNENIVDFQIHCGPALGSFNQYVRGTKYEKWKNRFIDEISLMLINDAVDVLNKKFLKLIEG